jgi:hypothetical protein
MCAAGFFAVLIMVNTPALKSVSAYQRISESRGLAESITTIVQTQQLHHFDFTLKPLLSFQVNVTKNKQHGMLYSLHDHLELVDQTGRILRNNKGDAIYCASLQFSNVWGFIEKSG